MSTHLLTRLAQALDAARIPYMIIGGQAVLLYGEPRLTRDIDITLGITPDDLEKTLHVVEEVHLRLLVENPTEFAQQTWVLPAMDDETGLRVDFIFSWTPYEAQAIERARAVEIDGYPVRFATPEDVILHKLFAGRARDLEDIRSILRKQSIDVTYIRQWGEAFSAALERDIWQTFEDIYQEVQQEIR